MTFFTITLLNVICVWYVCLLLFSMISISIACVSQEGPRLIDLMSKSRSGFYKSVIFGKQSELLIQGNIDDCREPGSVNIFTCVSFYWSM